MTRALSHRIAWLLAGAVVAGSGALWLLQARLAALEAAFETDARIVHRLLSQRVVQHDAVMSTLALLQPGGGDTPATLARLPSVYPQIVAVLQRPAGGQWPEAVRNGLAQAEDLSRTTRRAQMALADLPAGRYWLVLASTPASYALQIDLNATVPWDEWPMDPRRSPVRVALEHAGQHWSLQNGAPPTLGWTYGFHKTLASPSQPLQVVAERTVHPMELPWLALAAWSALLAAVGVGGRALWRQRVARQRAEELLRLGQVARLNTLGELAAGMAHELNQPLTALLANTQAAQRLLQDDPPEVDTARTAMARAVEQARRATQVVGRLRRLVERPELGGQVQPLALPAAASDVLHLLEPELAARGIAPDVSAAADLPPVLAEPVALQQIMHNLLMNALQALEQVPPAERSLHLGMARSGNDSVTLSVRDHGPGVPPDARTRLFEPFYSTRPDGLGLGLPLCENLAQAMGAHLRFAGPTDAATGRGAEFQLTLPVAAAPLPTAAP